MCAKVKFGMMVVDARGKLGGQVFSKNRSGSYIRTKVTPSNPNTSFQAAARALLSALSSAWRGLTAAQISAWNAAVDSFTGTNVFGDSARKTGKNLYTSLNANLDSIGVAAISEPPLPVAVGEVSITGLSMDTGPLLDYTTNAFPATETMQVWATPGLSPGVSNPGSKYRLIATHVGTGIAQALDDGAAYAARFGNPVEGQKVFVKVVGVNGTTGQKGIANVYDTIVLA